jgi:hypothetical protein
MEIFIEEKTKDLERIYINLKVCNSARYESRMTFDDFHSSIEKSMHKKSGRWVEHVYAKLLKSSQSTSTPLVSLFMNIVPYFQRDIGEENFYIPMSEIDVTIF